MKIFKQEPTKFVRLQITQQLQPTEYITLTECTREEVEKFVKDLIIENIKSGPFITGKRTSVNIREAVGGSNGKSKSFSFYGSTPAEIKQLIQTNLEP